MRSSSKDLKEGSDKELAGVLAVFFNKPVSELVEAAIQGKMLETDKNTQAFRVWKPDASADEAFADVGLSATDTEEAKFFANASPGSGMKHSIDRGQMRDSVTARLKRMREQMT